MVRRKKNSGYGSIPRNEGLKLARGKYIFFMDSDDLILQDALENLYNVAEETQADVVMCKKRYVSFGEGEEFFNNLTLDDDSQDNVLVMIDNDLKTRMQFWFKDYFPVAAWRKFIRRDFLIENKIEFLNVMQEDSLWTFELVCLAKKITMTPQICYIYRKQRQDSVCGEAYSTELTPDKIRKKFDRVMFGLKHIDELMSRLEFFQNNSDYRYAVLDHIVTQNITWIILMYKNFSPILIYENFKAAFKNDMGKFDVLIAYLVSNLFARIIDFHASYHGVKSELEELKKLHEGKTET